MARKNSLIDRVRSIQITAKQRVLDLFYGAYRSAFKGRGIEVEDLREYVPGDDVRAISWSRTALMGRPFIKTFREERDLVVTLVVDISASCNFSSRYEVKRERMAEVGALLAFSAIYNHDKVSLLLFSDHVEKYIPPKRGERHGIRLVRELLSFQPKGKKTDIGRALAFLQKTEKKSAIVFLISDFLDEEYKKEFMLASKKDDLIAVRVRDPYELNMPLMGLTRFVDEETDQKQLIDVNDSYLKEFRAKAADNNRRFAELVGKSGASSIEISTEGSFEQDIFLFFQKRERILGKI